MLYTDREGKGSASEKGWGTVGERGRERMKSCSMSGWRSGGSESIRKGGSSHFKFIAKYFDVKQGLQGPQKPS